LPTEDHDNVLTTNGDKTNVDPRYDVPGQIPDKSIDLNELEKEVTMLEGLGILDQNKTD
jgi:hypothetical protein